MIKQYLFFMALIATFLPSLAHAEGDDEIPSSEQQPIVLAMADTTSQADTEETIPSDDKIAAENTKQPQEQSKAPQEGQAQAPAPTQVTPEMIAGFKARMEANPQDLDAFFQYAQASTALGKFEEAELAYIHMLEINPELHRVRLDLGVLKMRMGEFKNAKILFEQVLATNPPDAVKQNIAKVLEIANNNLKQHIFSGSASFGFNHDSNATSSASSGETTYANTSIPLAADSRTQKDNQYVQVATLSYLYKFDIDSKLFGASISTTGTFYKTIQDNENQLNLTLYSIKTGPVFDLKKLNMQFGISGTESIIYLHSEKYITSPSGDLTFKYAPLNNLLFDYAYSYEHKNTFNTPDAPTNTDRKGHATQHKVGVTYALTQKDIFNTSVTWRDESTQYNPYSNFQAGISGSYTRMLPYDMSFNALVSLKDSHYAEPDDSVSTEITRKDIERSMTYTLSKKLPKNISVSAGYQYKDTTSNIQNYAYTDHRYSATVGWSF
jgi:tetratricopeptide (TPR) repeat protein